ncbi:MAG: Do family serine endopeptidase [Fulvimarina manganoxydans]|uniref:Do family serine endopeptidase n=1 Tax=Fulvimarina manganoxydans TaxID=937218 RepID=UPI0023530453|nr:Do family serine endopeptidase [Fulvimarina manganoxydans]MCK5934446.1 Do family serine endopeptidase [Fulvimarina manganoxydans]
MTVRLTRLLAAATLTLSTAGGPSAFAQGAAPNEAPPVGESESAPPAATPSPLPPAPPEIAAPDAPSAPSKDNAPMGTAEGEGANPAETPAPPEGEPDPAQQEAVVPALPVPPAKTDPANDGPTAVAEPQTSPSTPAFQPPPSVADLAEGLLDAVVNISTAQRIEQAGRGIPPLEAPEGSPLQDFFDDLLKGDDQSGRRVQSLGSGFVIDSSGVIVTNNHVIQDADEITVNFADGSQLDAELVGRDPKTDLAVLKVEPKEPLKAVAFGNSDGVRIGDWVMAIGNPFGLGGSVSIGIVSARGRNINAGPYDNFIQTDAAINRGNSGGPLFDMDGDVVGINTAIISPTGGSIGIGFSIPANLAVNVVDQLREFGETRRGWLGIRLSAVTDDIASGLGIGETRGAVVMGIIPGGPSDDGSLKVGDVIVGFDGKPVESSRDLPRIVAETPVGKTVEVDILRKASRDADAEPTSVEITLGRLEEGEKLMAEAEGAPSGEETDSTESDTPGSESEDRDVLGMTLGAIDDAARETYGLDADAKGVLVTAVEAGSGASQKGIEPGMTIREIAQEEVSTVDEVTEKLASLREEGRRNALMLVAATDGALRFIVLPLE